MQIGVIGPRGVGKTAAVSILRQYGLAAAELEPHEGLYFEGFLIQVRTRSADRPGYLADAAVDNTGCLRDLRVRLLAAVRGA